MHTLRVGIVVGEPSGDALGAALVQALRARGISVHLEGIGGPQLQAQGCQNLASMDTLTVMGFTGLIKRLPRLLSLRWFLRRHFIAHPPDIFIGIDAPDFTLALEKRLKHHHIPTVHYVSPSVWAWRPGRVKKVARAANLLLTLFPFELDYYPIDQYYGLQTRYVGHPLADDIPLVPDQCAARTQLGLMQDSVVIALLPGSREQEISYMAPLLLETAVYFEQQWSALGQRAPLIFIAPMANSARLQQFEAIRRQIAPQLAIRILLEQSHIAMAAATAVILTAGTATLEAMLLKKPMVIAYRTHSFSYWIEKQLVKTPFIGLPNILAGRQLVPEYIQAAATPQNLGDAILYYLNQPTAVQQLHIAFSELHRNLRCQAADQAARAIQMMVLAAGLS